MTATCFSNTVDTCLPDYMTSHIMRHVLHIHGRESLKSHKNKFCSRVWFCQEYKMKLKSIALLLRCRPHSAATVHPEKGMELVEAEAASRAWNIIRVYFVKSWKLFAWGTACRNIRIRRIFHRQNVSDRREGRTQKGKLCQPLRLL